MLKRTLVNNSDLSHQLPAQFTNLSRLWIQGPIAPEKTFPFGQKTYFHIIFLQQLLKKTKPPV